MKYRMIRNDGIRCAALAIAMLLLVAIGSAPRLAWSQEGPRRVGMDHIMQLGLAWHNYLQVHGTFPPQARYDAAGRPLLSWRVLILPYIDEQALYDQFKLDEPWDSEHNLKLLDKMPAVYAGPVEKVTDTHMTSVVGPVGKGYIFDGKPGRKWAEVAGAHGTTVSLIETKTNIPWTKPQDLQGEALAPGELTTLHPDGFLVGVTDGATMFFPKDLPREEFIKRLTVVAEEAVK